MLGTIFVFGDFEKLPKRLSTCSQDVYYVVERKKQCKYGIKYFWGYT